MVPDSQLSEMSTISRNLSLFVKKWKIYVFSWIWLNVSYLSMIALWGCSPNVFIPVIVFVIISFPKVDERITNTEVEWEAAKLSELLWGVCRPLLASIWRISLVSSTAKKTDQLLQKLGTFGQDWPADPEGGCISYSLFIPAWSEHSAHLPAARWSQSLPSEMIWKPLTCGIVNPNSGRPRRRTHLHHYCFSLFGHILDRKSNWWWFSSSTWSPLLTDGGGGLGSSQTRNQVCQ